MSGKRHASTYARLVANTAEPDSPCGCWHWTGATRMHGNGRRPAMSVRVPGVKSPRKVNPCRTMLEQFGPLPDEHNASHLCANNWCCINPDHLIGEPFGSNIARRWGRHGPLPVAAAPVDDDPDWRAGALCDPSLIPF